MARPALRLRSLGKRSHGGEKANAKQL